MDGEWKNTDGDMDGNTDGNMEENTDRWATQMAI